MFMRRRRPLLRAAMVGGAGYMAGKAGQRNQYREQDQEARMEQLEAQPAAAPAPAPAPAAAAGGDLVGQLKQLSDLLASGALTQDEFDAAKKKLLAN
ncbi:MAG: SHOCT domain-containing protein [Solirubrobacteraceae bacterium]